MTDNWIEKTIPVQNKHSLHLRPAAKISEHASTFECDICVQFAGEKEREWNAKSIFDLIEFAAEFSRSKQNSFILKAKGQNSELAINELIELIQKEIEN